MGIANVREMGVLPDLPGGRYPAPPRLAQSNHYSFCLSPSESWLALVRGEPGRYMTQVVHIPSEKTWLARLPPSVLESKVFPGCFSPDERRLDLGPASFEISPGMESLKRVAGQSEEPPATGPAWRGDRQDPNSAFNLPDGLEASAASPDGRVVYQAVELGKDGVSQLRLSPSGEVRSIDFGAVLLEVARKERVDAADARRKLNLLWNVILTPAIWHGDPTYGLQLRGFVVSPDGKYLAGHAIRLSDGGKQRPFGVLISLREKRLVAHPFTNWLLGKVVWARDSSAFYFATQADLTSHYQENFGEVFRMNVEDVLRRKE